MQTSKVHPLFRLFPSLTDLAFLMPIGVLFLVLNGAKTMLGDGDTGWHLRTGEWILQHGRVPTVDMFSFTKPGEPWFAWEWLWDVFFGWMHLHWGMEAVVLGSILVLCVTSALLFRLAFRQSGNALVAAAVTLVATIASSVHWLARPHLFTLLFIVVYLSILERVREGRTRLLIALPALMLLWTNLHGGFIAGLVVIGAYAAGEWITALLTPDAGARRAAFSRGISYAAAAAACLAVSFLNPYGYKLHTHIVEYLLEPYHSENITEFQSISFHAIEARSFEALLALGVIAAFWSFRRGQYGRALLIVMWAHQGLIAARNIPLYALIGAPVIAECLQHAITAIAQWHVAGWLRNLGRRMQALCSDVSLIDGIPRLHASSVLAFAGLMAVMYAPGATGKAKAEYDPKHYPAAAVRTLGAAELNTAVFTDDEWGDYLIYTLYPKGKVFVDGRSDFYGPAFGKKFLGVLKVNYDWQSTLDRYTVRTILLPVTSPLVGALKESRNWSVAYDDGLAIAFRANTPEMDRHSHFAAIRGENHRDRGITKPIGVISRSLVKSTRKISQ